MSVDVERLQKKYGRVVAVKDLTFHVPQASLFAFLGSNGAGKSTTIGCATTTVAPTSGTVRVAGHDVVTDAAAARAAIGCVFQTSLLDPLLTVRENLALRASFYGMTTSAAAARITTLTDMVGIGSFLDRRHHNLSGGQRRRADIARALLQRPAVLFLDEPTAGLDPQSRQQIWHAINTLRRHSGTTIFLTTHYLEETERADQVCIIEKGSIVAEGTPADLRARYSSSTLTVRTTHPDHVRAQCARHGVRAEADGDGIRIAVASSTQARELLAVLDIDDFEFRHGTMDDVFLAVTGGRIS